MRRPPHPTNADKKAFEGIQPGDRRQFKSVGAAQGFAYLSGADRVEPEHPEILASTLWDGLRQLQRLQSVDG